jgi:hypothetical protein
MNPVRSGAGERARDGVVDRPGGTSTKVVRVRRPPLRALIGLPVHPGHTCLTTPPAGSVPGAGDRRCRRASRPAGKRVRADGGVVTVRKVFDGSVRVAYVQMYVDSRERWSAIEDDHRAGRVNGLCGAAGAAGSLLLTTGERRHRAAAGCEQTGELGGCLGEGLT